MGLLGPPGRSPGGRGADPGESPSAALREPHPMNGRLNPGVGLGRLAPSVNHHESCTPMLLGKPLGTRSAVQTDFCQIAFKTQCKMEVRI